MTEWPGNHSFVGLGFAGLRGAVRPGLGGRGVSQAAEGVLVNAPDATNSVMGLYYSTDAGVTWQMSTIDGRQPGGADSTAFRWRPAADAATAVVWNAVRQRFYAAVRYHGYYESADGVTWTRLAHQPGTGLTATACPTDPGTTGSASCPIFRGALAVQAATGDMFALTVDANNLDQGLWQDVCALSGTSCAQYDRLRSASSCRRRRWRWAAAARRLRRRTMIWRWRRCRRGEWLDAGHAAVCGHGGSLSLLAGRGMRAAEYDQCGEWMRGAAQVAPAQHAIAALATSADSRLLYLGNDGGLWRSTDGVNQQQTPCSPDDATHFQNLNGGLGSLAEVVSFAQHPNGCRRRCLWG